MKNGIGRKIVACTSALLVGSAVVMTACSGDDNAVVPSEDGGNDGTAKVDTSVAPIDSGADTTAADSSVSDASAGDAEPVSDAGADAEIDSGLHCVYPAIDCNGACTAVASDNANCGTCGHACTASSTCAAGRCSNAVAQVSAGTRFACAAKIDGTVWCWGENDFGELGVAPSASDQTCGGGTSHCNKTPQQIAGLTNVTSVAAGTEFACAVKKDGSVWCWGKNQYGELGHASGTMGDTTCTDATPDAGGSIACNAVPTQVTFPTALSIAAMSAGEDVACARVTPPASDGGDAGVQGGDLYCWGDNVHDTVGLFGPDGAADPTHQPTLPTKIGVFASDVIDMHVALGSHHACALRAAGTVYCWGDDGEGRLGTLPNTGGDCANGSCTPVPQQVKLQTVVDAGGDASGDTVVGGALTGMKQVRAGAEASCALKSDGTVWCWGSDQWAALADKGPYADPYAHPGARQIPVIPAVKGIAQHSSSVFAIDSTGSIFAWGENTFGELGLGSEAGKQCPAGLTSGTCGATPVLAQPHMRTMAAGAHFAVAVRADDTVWAWGRNGHAQLGHAPTAGGDTTCTGPVESAPCNATPSQVTFP